MHNEYSNIPKFRPVVDTTGTPHCSAGKFLTNLLNPLSMNEFTLKDSFDAVNKIKSIPPHFLTMDTAMHLLMWNCYLQIFPSKEP